MIDINPSQTTPSPPSQPDPQGRSQSPASPSPPPTLQEAFPRYVPPAPQPETSPPPPPPPQGGGTSKGLIFVLIILIFALGGTTALFGYQNYQLKQEVQNLQTITPTPVPTTEPTLPPTPTPTPDPNADWETYTNNYWSFSIKYPPEKFTICKAYTTEEEGTRLWPADFTCPSGTDAFYVIGVVGNKPGEYSEYKTPASTEQIVINGENATKKIYIYDEQDGPLFDLEQSTEVTIETDKGIIEFQLLGNNPEETLLFNQILSTLKFPE